MMQLIHDRIGRTPVWVLMIEVFLGLGWARAAAEKLISPDWWSGEYLEEFLDEHQGLEVGWYDGFVDVFVEPNTVLVSVAVLWLQIFLATLFLTGQLRGLAVGLGLFLNLQFVAAGAVDPSAFYLMLQGAIGVWLLETMRSRIADELARVIALAGAGLAIVSAPFVSTLHPAEVIHDPALMLTTVGALATGATAVLMWRQSDDAAAMPSRADQAPVVIEATGRPAR